MYRIIDDCDTDCTGLTFDTLGFARAVRREFLGDYSPVENHVHVAEVATGRLIPEPGAWVGVDDEGQGYIFNRDDEDRAWDMYGDGSIVDRPLWVPNYEWF